MTWMFQHLQRPPVWKDFTNDGNHYANEALSCNPPCVQFHFKDWFPYNGPSGDPQPPCWIRYTVNFREMTRCQMLPEGGNGCTCRIRGYWSEAPHKPFQWRAPSYPAAAKLPALSQEDPALSQAAAVLQPPTTPAVAGTEPTTAPVQDGFPAKVSCPQQTHVMRWGVKTHVPEGLIGLQVAMVMAREGAKEVAQEGQGPVV